ncbi:hypothetical protein ACSSS7_006345 [Eimeria intestinalis]
MHAGVCMHQVLLAASCTNATAVTSLWPAAAAAAAAAARRSPQQQQLFAVADAGKSRGPETQEGQQGDKVIVLPAAAAAEAAAAG